MDEDPRAVEKSLTSGDNLGTRRAAYADARVLSGNMRPSQSEARAVVASADPSSRKPRVHRSPGLSGVRHAECRSWVHPCIEWTP